MMMMMMLLSENKLKILKKEPCLICYKFFVICLRNESRRVLMTLKFSIRSFMQPYIEVNGLLL